MRIVAAMMIALLAAATPAAAQHDMAGMDMSGGSNRFVWHWGAHGVGLLTRVSPAVRDTTLTEAYLTQAALMGGVGTRGGTLSLLTTISLEGLTLDRGELGPGTYGEGYVDRRHPHTYLHELVAVVQHDLPLGLTGSIAGGRGFAPFGTDDPMMRPMVRFPVNHHLSQVLERLFVTGGITAGPATLEVGTFSGNEPLSPRDLGDVDRFADSWSARVTLRPAAAWELQASRAIVASPEEPTGEGDDQRKVSASSRYEGTLGDYNVYGLGEWSRTTIVTRRGDSYATSSLLAEGSVARSDWSAAIRLEQSERPEEGRTGNFRTPWPPIEHFVIGITQWRVASLHVQRDVRWRMLSLSPFVETSLAHVSPSEGDLFDPKQFYGSNNLWTVSGGLRMDLGMKHGRMGRYGVALPRAPMSHH